MARTGTEGRRCEYHPSILQASESVRPLLGVACLLAPGMALGRGRLEVVVVEHDGLSRRLARSTTASEGLRNCSVDSEVGGPNTWPLLASVRFH